MSDAYIGMEARFEGYDEDDLSVENPVRWWFFFSYEDGFQFGRGGRLPTVELAALALDEAFALLQFERALFLSRR